LVGRGVAIDIFCHIRGECDVGIHGKKGIYGQDVQFAFG
jgi:hypothetical protein